MRDKPIFTKGFGYTYDGDRLEGERDAEAILREVRRVAKELAREAAT